MFKKLLTLGIFLLAPVAIAFAQTGSVTGTITDAKTGETIIGANVYINSVQRGASTNLDGKYTISNLESGTYTLRVTFVGYRNNTIEVNVGSGVTTQNVELQRDLIGLDEVVVSGIASETSKAQSQVAVATVNAEQLTEANTYSSVSELLGGKAAGVRVNASSGNAGSGIRFDIRSGGGLNGNDQPVIYLDGIRLDNAENVGFGVGGQGTSTLADINPENIENVEILKGPAGAALYGTSGSNGVVLITTKKGSVSPGETTLNIRYKVTRGFNEQREEYSEDNFVSAPDANAIFRTGDIQQHTLSASGGSEFIRYFTSLDLRNEEGIIQNNSFDRDAFRANFDVFPSDKVTISASTSFTLSEANRPQNDNNIFGFLGNTLLFPDSYVFTDSAAVVGLENELSSQRFLGSIQATYTPIENLDIRGSIGYDGNNSRNDELKPANLGFSGVTQGERSFFTRRNDQFTWDANARYGYDITSDLRATSIVGGQLFTRRFQSAFFQRQNFQTELITNIGAGADFQLGNEGFFNTRELGVFAQQELSYKDTYLLSLGLRRDFAAALGSEAPDIYYPKASAAIRLDKLNFLPSAFNFFKIRAAYGETGVLPGLNDAQQLLFNSESSGVGGGAVIDFIGNPDIQPERIREFTVGADFEIAENYAFEFTYYIQRASDSIIDFNNAPSTGLTASAVPFNVGAVEGRGVEASVRVTPVRTKNFQLDFGIIGNYADNEVTDLGGAQPIFDGFDLNVVAEGLPESAFFVPAVNGAIFDENGVFDGVDVDAERSFRGRVVPEYNGSFNVTARIQNLSVYALAEWAANVSVFNNTQLFSAFFGNNATRNRLQEELAELTPQTPEYIETANALARTNPNFDDNYIEDAGFYGLSEVSVSYNLTSLLRNNLSASFVKNLTLSASGRNLILKSPYSGVDPGVNFSGSRSGSRNQDFLTLQRPRVFNFTVSLGL